MARSRLAVGPFGYRKSGSLSEPGVGLSLAEFIWSPSPPALIPACSAAQKLAARQPGGSIGDERD